MTPGTWRSKVAINRLRVAGVARGSFTLTDRPLIGARGDIRPSCDGGDNRSANVQGGTDGRGKRDRIVF